MEEQENNQNIQNMADTAFANQYTPNLIMYELEFSDILEQIERLLRGDITYADKAGNIRWKRNNDPETMMLNERGIRGVINYLHFYLHKNNLLSCTTETESNEIIYHATMEFADMLISHRDLYGWGDDPQGIEKRKNFSTIVCCVSDQIAFACRRSISAGERNAHAKNVRLSQTDNLNMNPQSQMMMMPQIEKKGVIDRVFGR